jgi:hypothetical protein
MRFILSTIIVVFMSIIKDTDGIPRAGQSSFDNDQQDDESDESVMRTPLTAVPILPTSPERFSSYVRSKKCEPGKIKLDISVLLFSSCYVPIRLQSPSSRSHADPK